MRVLNTPCSCLLANVACKSQKARLSRLANTTQCLSNDLTGKKQRQAIAEAACSAL